MCENAFHQGSARASRANFGALAEILFELLILGAGQVRDREGAIAGRWGACAPQKFRSSAREIGSFIDGRFGNFPTL
jgi:hypothetical protein